MSRYIDAEKILPYISRLLGGMPLAVMKMAETDGIDIVRCAECKHNYYGTCEYAEWHCKDSDFCSYGEKGVSDEQVD